MNYRLNHAIDARNHGHGRLIIAYLALASMPFSSW